MSDRSDVTQGLDTGATTRWLAGLGIGIEEPVDYARVGLGQSNLTYLATDARGARVVLRRPPLGELLAEGLRVDALLGHRVAEDHDVRRGTLPDRRRHRLEHQAVGGRRRQPPLPEPRRDLRRRDVRGRRPVRGPDDRRPGGRPRVHPAVGWGAGRPRRLRGPGRTGRGDRRGPTALRGPRARPAGVPGGLRRAGGKSEREGHGEGKEPGASHDPRA